MVRGSGGSPRIVDRAKPDSSKWRRGIASPPPIFSRIRPLLETQADTRVVAPAEDVINRSSSIRARVVEGRTGEKVRRLVVEQIVHARVELIVLDRCEADLRVEVELRRHFDVARIQAERRKVDVILTRLP